MSLVLHFCNQDVVSKPGGSEPNIGAEAIEKSIFGDRPGVGVGELHVRGDVEPRCDLEVVAEFKI
jgi:hypothetical protein